MAILIICCAALTIAYVSLMLLYGYGWKSQPIFRLPDGFSPKTTVSVIIPARNEAANIAGCIRSVLSQDYPQHLLETILVDDHSEDDTSTIAQREGGKRLRIISLKDFIEGGSVNSFKKKALATGIAQSSGELIVTMDADCIAPPLWLKNITALYEKRHSAMIIGPVAFTNDGSLLQAFQSLDFTMMQGITAAAHRLKLGGMANGANLAFSRAAFEAVGGYRDTEHLASGDDYLLLQKMSQHFPERIHYLKVKDAIVATSPQLTWSTFLNQRVRWASKSGKYPDHRLTAILMLVYAFNVSLLVLFVAAFWHSQLWVVLGAALLTKTISELALLIPVASFYRKEKELRVFPLLQPLHIIYIIAAGFFGMKGGYRWKGRKVK